MLLPGKGEVVFLPKWKVSTILVLGNVIQFLGLKVCKAFGRLFTS